MNKIITFLIALLLTIPSFAQSEKKDDKSSQKDQILAAKVAYFVTEIGLTPEEAQAFWPIYNKCWDDAQKAHKDTRKSLKEIKALNEKGGFSDSEMKKLIDKYIGSYMYEGKIQEMYLGEFYKILPVEKVARIYIAEDGFRKKLTEMWKEQSQKKPNTEVQNDSSK